MPNTSSSTDDQRIGLAEMIENLRSHWREGMSVDAIIDLRDDLDAMLQRIRSERHIRPPVLRCQRCGHVGEGADPHVSVRAMIIPPALRCVLFRGRMAACLQGRLPLWSPASLVAATSCLFGPADPASRSGEQVRAAGRTGLPACG